MTRSDGGVLSAGELGGCGDGGGGAGVGEGAGAGEGGGADGGCCRVTEIRNVTMCPPVSLAAMVTEFAPKLSGTAEIIQFGDPIAVPM